MRSAGTSRRRSTSRAVNRDGHDDPIRPMGMTPRERRVIAPDFRPGTFRMRQEIEIVNRDHTSGGARRKQQRMRRVRHVERASGQASIARPAQPMPRQIHDADRHAPIDDGRAIDARLAREPILPGAREERQIERRRSRLAGTRRAGRAPAGARTRRPRCVRAAPVDNRSERARVEVNTHDMTKCLVLDARCCVLVLNARCFVLSASRPWTCVSDSDSVSYWEMKIAVVGNRVCGPGCRRVSRREREHRMLRRQGRGQDSDASVGQDSDLRAGTRRTGAAQPC